jgi:uncharacterized membrane protein
MLPGAAAAEMVMGRQDQQPSIRQHWQSIGKDTDEILNVRREVLRRRGRMAAFTDRIGRILSQPLLFTALLALHLGWVLLNLPLWPWRPWDPYPFTFLATIASAEAPFITLLILMNQRRERDVSELRDEILLQVALHSERQSTMTLRLLREIQQKLDVDTDQSGEILERMQENLDPRHLLENVRRSLRRDEGSDSGMMP